MKKKAMLTELDYQATIQTPVENAAHKLSIRKA
jgi:hypothetical protein